MKKFTTLNEAKEWILINSCGDTTVEIEGFGEVTFNPEPNAIAGRSMKYWQYELLEQLVYPTIYQNTH